MMDSYQDWIDLLTSRPAPRPFKKARSNASYDSPLEDNEKYPRDEKDPDDYDSYA